MINMYDFIVIETSLKVTSYYWCKHRHNNNNNNNNNDNKDKHVWFSYRHDRGKIFTCVLITHSEIEDISCQIPKMSVHFANVLNLPEGVACSLETSILLNINTRHNPVITRSYFSPQFFLSFFLSVRVRTALLYMWGSAEISRRTNYSSFDMLISPKHPLYDGLVYDFPTFLIPRACSKEFPIRHRDWSLNGFAVIRVVSQDGGWWGRWLGVIAVAEELFGWHLHCKRFWQLRQ